MVAASVRACTLHDAMCLGAHQEVLYRKGTCSGPVRTDTAGPKELRRGEHWCGGGAWQSPLLPGDARPQTKRLWSEKEKLDLLVHMP